MSTETGKKAAATSLETYRGIVERFIFASDGDEAEVYLVEAFELGRALVGQQVSPDEIVGLHDEAVDYLAQAYPELPLSSVAKRLTKPLMEMSMAYGLAFREQMAQRYEAMVNARLEQSSKLEAVGLLAAGIAHDFNNIVGSIVGFAEMTAEARPADVPVQGNVAQILVACRRARDLVARMLSFARQGPAIVTRLDIVAQVREAQAMLAASRGPNVRIRFEPLLEQAFILGDPVQIQQIVMNLGINAAAAMEGNGEIAIRLMPAGAMDGTPPEHSDDVCLLVADHGCGMSPEVQARVFDPFFTTRAPNGGSGLGLSVVYGIVKDLGGRIDIRSRSTGPQRGTEFRIYLPMARAGV